jgi:hypothetical protein
MSVPECFTPLLFLPPPPSSVLLPFPSSPFAPLWLTRAGTRSDEHRHYDANAGKETQPLRRVYDWLDARGTDPCFSGGHLV